MLSRHFGSMFNDPFFEGHHHHARDMEKFFRDPFAGFHDPLSIEDSFCGRRRHRGGDRRERGGHRGDEVATRSPFDFGGMFQGMQQMMENMNKNFSQIESDPNCHVMSHSSYSSYTNTGGEGSKPKMFQATTTTHKAPGGVRETRKTLRDSESGREKMAIGRYLGDKGHVVQRQRNLGSGHEEENQEYVNMAEDEYNDFDHQWKEKTSHYNRGGGRDLRNSEPKRRHPRSVKF